MKKTKLQCKQHVWLLGFIAVLACFMTLTFKAGAVQATEETAENQIVEQGTFGTAPWDVSADGVMTIHPGTLGAGAGNWMAVKDKILKVNIEPGVIANEDSSHLFDGMFKLRKDPVLHDLNIKNLNTSNVRDMSYMFANNPEIRYLDLTNFNTSKVTNMSHLFADDQNIFKMDVSSFDTSQVVDMQYMFYGLNISSPDVSNFNTSKVTNMRAMFSQCGWYTMNELDLSSFDTSKVTDMSEMFYYDVELRSINLSSFDTSNVINMGGMFGLCANLISLDVSNFNTSKVRDMGQMFYSCRALKQLELSSFNTSNVEAMAGMFKGCSSLERLNVSSFNTSAMGSEFSSHDMNEMFAECPALTGLDLTNFDTSGVTSMGKMFNGDRKITELDLGGFDTSKVTYINNMFLGMSSLWKLTIGDKTNLVSERDQTNAGLADAPGNNTLIQDAKDPNTNYYSISNKWQEVDASKNGTEHDPKGTLYTAQDVIQQSSNPAGTRTYVWQQQPEEQQGVDDLTDLYEQVKTSIWNAGGLFTTAPANSMKYQAEFGGRSIFGALDNAYNLKNRAELLQMMHQSIQKVHESMATLTVNEPAAEAAGLDVAQLKAELATDTVPYDYSKDEEVAGIQKQLDAYAQARIKYNKFVSQGIFDSSDYWSN